MSIACRVIFSPICSDLLVHLLKNMRNEWTTHVSVDGVAVTQLVVVLKQLIQTHTDSHVLEHNCVCP